MGKPLPSSLRPALNSPLVTSVFNELYRDLLGSQARIRKLTGEILKRRTVRYTVALENARYPTSQLIGKVYASRAEGEAGLAALLWLWEKAFSSLPPADIVVPRVMTFLPELSLLVMEQGGGQSLKRLLRNGLARDEDMRAFANALTKLHGFPAAYGAPFTLEHHLERRCAGMSGALASAFPELSSSIDRTLATARKVEEEALPGFVLSHGDYHPGQLHIDEKCLWLIDLDGLNHGDPAYDVAMAVVTLKGMGVKLGGARFDRLVRSFLDGYFTRMDRSIAARVPLQAALIFLKRACKRFRWQNAPQWREEISVQIRRAQECLDLYESRPRDADLSTAIDLCAACPAAQ